MKWKKLSSLTDLNPSRPTLTSRPTYHYIQICVYWSQIGRLRGGCFSGKMCSDRRKSHGCGQKKPESTSSAIFAPLRNTASSSVVPTEFAATKMKSSKANLVTWIFCLSPKRQLSIHFNFFFPFTDIWYFFSSSKLHFCRTESFC